MVRHMIRLLYRVRNDVIVVLLFIEFLKWQVAWVFIFIFPDVKPV